MLKLNKKGVVVGVSGGVDSSVSLAILKEQGLRPVGIFFKFWGEKNNCCGSEAEKNARKVCSDSGIPFYVIDLRDYFKNYVVDYFINSYKNGITPNPCVVCNKQIKFHFLFQKAKEFGFSYIATGHYASIKEGSIYKAKDLKKDQTYFLWQLSKKDLKRIIFPLANLTKEEVRKKATNLKIITAKAKESQEVCFVESDLKSFLSSYFSLFPGEIKDLEGNKLGVHQGLPIYTIGQRKKIGLSGGPFYVSKKDNKTNSLIVTTDKDKIASKDVFFENSNFFENINYPIEVSAKIRYNGKEKSGILKSENNFSFFERQNAITPGQSIVFYLKDRLLGGGVIKNN